MGSEATASEATINQGAMGSEARASEATINQGATGSEARGGEAFILVGLAVNALDAHAPKPYLEDRGAIRAKVTHRIRFAPCLASLCGHACSRATLTCHSCYDWVIRTFTQALDCDSMFPCQYRTQRSQPGSHSTGSPGLSRSLIKPSARSPWQAKRTPPPKRNWKRHGMATRPLGAITFMGHLSGGLPACDGPPRRTKPPGFRPCMRLPPRASNGHARQPQPSVHKPGGDRVRSAGQRSV